MIIGALSEPKTGENQWVEDHVGPTGISRLLSEQALPVFENDYSCRWKPFPHVSTVFIDTEKLIIQEATGLFVSPISFAASTFVIP